MADKTGFDKFISKQVGSPVQIRPKSNVRTLDRSEREAAPAVEETPAPAPAQAQVAKRPAGRPRKVENPDQPKLVVLNFQVDENLKQILENLKYRTHKTTIRGVMLEAIDLLLEKYGIEK